MFKYVKVYNNDTEPYIEGDIYINAKGFIWLKRRQAVELIQSFSGGKKILRCDRKEIEFKYELPLSYKDKILTRLESIGE